MENDEISLPASLSIRPDFGLMTQRIDLISDVFQLPDAPIKKTNSPGKISS
jgi:hypothetical protein